MKVWLLEIYNSEGLPQFSEIHDSLAGAEAAEKDIMDRGFHVVREEMTVNERFKRFELIEK